MKWTSVNVVAGAETDGRIDQMIHGCTVPIWMWARPWKQFRAAREIIESVKGIVMHPQRVVRVRRAISYGHSGLITPGRLMVIGPRRIAIEQEETDDAN